MGGFELGFWSFMGFALQSSGMLYTTAQRSALLVYLNMIFVPIFSWFLFGQRAAKYVWLSVGLALIGTALVLNGASSSGQIPPNVGDLLSLFAAAASAMFILRLETYAPKASCTRLTAVGVFAASLLCGIWTLVVAAGNEFSIGTVLALFRTLYVEKFWAILYLGIITTAFASWLQTLAQRSVPATSVSVIFALDAVWACVFAYLWLGETLNLESFVGAAFLLVAILGQLLMQSLATARAGEPEARGCR
jgi:drug/metabolite transporter (DMT)-like permease